MQPRIGPCRYLASAKPRKTRPEVGFFLCAACGRLLTGWPPTGESGGLSCCGKAMTQLQPILAEGPALDYEIVGGPNENAIRVTWEGERPLWLYLETFRGGQYIEVGKNDRRTVFALAGEDAYAYCDKDPCEECSFRCKHGFTLFGWFEKSGFLMLPLNRISASSGKGENRKKTL